MTQELASPELTQPPTPPNIGLGLISPNEDDRDPKVQEIIERLQKLDLLQLKQLSKEVENRLNG